jgi:hypothetical protein
MSSSHKLDAIQRWMQAVVTHPRGVERGIESPEARRQIDVAVEAIESVVLRSATRTSIERLEVYGNCYFLRLLECMRAFFPALADTLGKDVFNGFAYGYLCEHPPSSYTLDRLADRFVHYLESTRPELESCVDTGDGADDRTRSLSMSWPEFIIDLARLEATINEVFDGPGVERESTLSADQLSLLTPEQWAAARLEPVPCLRLLAFRYPVNDFYTSFRRGEDPRLPEPENTCAAITRRDYVVRRFNVSRSEFDLLSALVAGQTVGDAIAACAESHAAPDELAPLIQSWFRNWSANAFFRQIRASR